MTDERIAELMGWHWPTSVHPDDMLAKVRAVVHEAKPEWQGLTDDDVHELTKEVIAFKSDVVKFIREAEAKLREKNA